MRWFERQDNEKGGFWHRNRAYVLAALCVCVGLLLLTCAGSDAKATTSADEDAYVRALEEQLTELCSSVEGVGRCRVMITLAASQSTVYDGTRVVEVVPPRVQGVTVICTGGADAQVKKDLSDMLGALFDIGRHHIVVLPLKN